MKRFIFLKNDSFINTCGYKGNLYRLSVMKEFPLQGNSVGNVYNYNTFNGYKTNL